MLKPDALREEIRHLRRDQSAVKHQILHAPSTRSGPGPRSGLAGVRLSDYYTEKGLDPTRSRQGQAGRPMTRACCGWSKKPSRRSSAFISACLDNDVLTRTKATGREDLLLRNHGRRGAMAEEHGVNVVIAQGREAGGHRGMFLTEDIGARSRGCFRLLPQIVDVVRVPVVAAGGSRATDAGIAAAFAFGASAAQIGTAYLLTPQATTSAGASRRVARRARRCDPYHQSLYWASSARPGHALHARAGANRFRRAGLSAGDWRCRCRCAQQPRRTGLRRFLAPFVRRGRRFCARRGCAGDHAPPVARGADGHAGDGGEKSSAAGQQSSIVRSADIMRDRLESWLAHSGNFNRHAAYTATCRLLSAFGNSFERVAEHVRDDGAAAVRQNGCPVASCA